LGLPIIGKLLGHTQAQTTARYAHLADDPLRKASSTIGATIAEALDRRNAAHTSNAPRAPTRLACLHLWSALLSPPSPTTEPARLGVNCSSAMRVGIVVRKNEDCPSVSALLKSLEWEGLIEIKRQGHMKPNIYLPRFPPKMTASNGMA
jgi:hypothetical protein